MNISSFSLSVYAAENTDELKQELAVLKNQLQSLEARIDKADQSNKAVATVASNDANTAIIVSNDTTAKPINHVKKIKKRTKKKYKDNIQLSKNITDSSINSDLSSSTIQITNTNALTGDTQLLSWMGPDISALIAGGAAAGYSNSFGSNSAFNILDLNPLLLFSYKDLLLLQSSLDFSVDSQGNTDVNLDTLNLSLFLNNYATFGVGKFDSALGSFVRNISPAWINRLPDAPVGFNSDQAAPQSEIGIQLGGGFHLTEKAAMNYLLFVANGPLGYVDTTNIDIDHISTDGYINNYGNYVSGGRLGFLPIPKLEIGVSAAAGKLALINMSDNTTVMQRGRNYYVFGTDAAYKPGNWDLRAEYIQQQVSSQSTSIVPQAEKWKAWHLQAAYWIPSTKFEPVIRYGKFIAAVPNQSQRQWAFGLDYWFTSSIAAQGEYEVDQAQQSSGNNINVFNLQLVFGY